MEPAEPEEEEQPEALPEEEQPEEYGEMEGESEPSLTPESETTVEPETTAEPAVEPTPTPDPDAQTVYIYGPEKMRAGNKRYFKARFLPKNPKGIKVTWSLDCGPEVAQVFRNGQIWVRPKAKPGTIITLTCHVTGRDYNYQDWTGEATMQIEIKPKK